MVSQYYFHDKWCSYIVLFLKFVGIKSKQFQYHQLMNVSFNHKILIKDYICVLFYLLASLSKSQRTSKVLEMSEAEEKEAKEKLLNLFEKFGDLLFDIKKIVGEKVQSNDKIISDITCYLQTFVKDVDLAKVQDVNDLFIKIDPYYDFLDCQIIVMLSKRYTTPDISQEIKHHSKEAMEFRESKPVKVLREGLRDFYIPYIHDSGTTNVPNVIIKLNHAWDRVATEGLYTLLQHLLPSNHKESLLKLITISPGSVKIEYFLPKSKADEVKTNVKRKVKFFLLVGVFQLTINNDHILLEYENIYYDFNIALHYSAECGNVEAVEFLLVVATDVNTCNESGATALMKASECGHYQVVELLLEKKADPNIVTRNRISALYIATQNGHHEVVELLLKNTLIRIFKRKMDIQL